MQNAPGKRRIKAENLSNKDDLKVRIAIQIRRTYFSYISGVFSRFETIRFK